MQRGLACLGVLAAVALAPAAVLAQEVIPPPSPALGSNPWQGANPSPMGSEAFGPGGATQQCLQPRALSGAVASNDRDVILRFGRDVFYSVRLARACPALLEAGAHVVNIQRRSELICRADDMELAVAAGDGQVSRCRVASMSRMSTAELTRARAAGQR